MERRGCGSFPFLHALTRDGNDRPGWMTLRHVLAPTLQDSDCAQQDRWKAGNLARPTFCYQKFPSMFIPFLPPSHARFDHVGAGFSAFTAVLKRVLPVDTRSSPYDKTT